MLPWFGGLAVISYCASFDGGRHTLPFGADIAVTAAWSLVIYTIAARQSLPADRIADNVERASRASDLQPPVAATPHTGASGRRA
jgi:peptidoglycan/LPS O-acetylase OafA/YrhL